MDTQTYALDGCTVRPRGEAAPLASNVHDTALVFEGGGFRAAYTAGVASVLLERGIYFDEVCGLSAGASHSVDYLSRDTNRVRRAFIDTAVTHGGAGGFLRGEGYFDANYAYAGCVKDGFLPFDWQTFAANPAQLRIQSFEADTGSTATFTRESMTDFETMMYCVRASSTLPMMMHPITINGHLMLDGGLGVDAGIPTHLAEMDGYERFFFVATREKGYRKEPPSAWMRRLYHSWGKTYPHLEQALLTRHERYNAALDRLEQMAREGRALVVYPDEMPLSSTSTDIADLYTAYERGHAQARRDLPRWEEFLFG